MAKIYISSTYSDLREYRETVYHTLRQMRHDVIAMEDYVATDQRPLDKCLADVATCDLYVGLFAWRYGYIPDQDNPEHRSITELEYHQAEKLGIPRLIFLLDEEMPWPPPLNDHVTGEGDKGQRITALRGELGREKTVSFFKNPDQLARLVNVAVQQETGEEEAGTIRVDWRVHEDRFVAHMVRFAGARSAEAAHGRYTPLRLQPTQFERTPMGSELVIATWTELIQYPALVLLVGEAGSGKTTQLLHEAQRLAAKALTTSDVPLPFYLSLSGFAGGDANTLLEMAAVANGVETRHLKLAWQEEQRPICLLLDGAEEAGDVDALEDAIRGLCEELSETDAHLNHSLVVACRPGPLRDALRDHELPFHELMLTSLSDAEIDAFLARYGVPWLRGTLEARLREITQKPDLLAAFALSAPALPTERMPRNAGQIYELHVQHIFQVLGGSYDYKRVKKPILAHLAHRMLAGQQSVLYLDDSLLDEIAEQMEAIYRRYHRRRRILPYDWSAEEMLDEALDSPVLERVPGHAQAIRFGKQYFRDHFFAVDLAIRGLDSPEVLELAATLPLEQWSQALIVLLGIAPESRDLFEVLPGASLALATQLWFEHRPPQVATPTLIRDAYARKQIAVREQMQRELDGLEALIAAAENAHPLEQADLQYALLHIGEYPPSDASSADWPITFELVIRDRELSFRGYGGGTVRLGPLIFFRTQTFCPVALSVDIQRLDFDPLGVDIDFTFAHTPPAVFAGILFEALGHVDWLELAARCQWIATLTMDLAHKVESYPYLADILPKLHLRAVRYANLGQLLADDLGLSWAPVALPSVSTLPAPEVQDTYNNLRRLYSLVNQSRSLGLVAPSDTEPIEVSVAHEAGQVEGQVVGVVLTEAHVDRPDLVRFNVAQRLEKVRGGSCTSIVLDALCGSPHPSFITLQIEGVTDVCKATDADIRGVQVGWFEGGPYGWQVHHRVTIGRFASSRLAGFVVDQVARDPGDQAVHLNVDEVDAGGQAVALDVDEVDAGGQITGAVLDKLG